MQPVLLASTEREHEKVFQVSVFLNVLVDLIYKLIYKTCSKKTFASSQFHEIKNETYSEK